MKPWMIVIFVLLLVGIVGGAGYYGYRSNQKPERLVVEPQTVAVERGEVVQSVTAPGSLVDAGETTLRAPADAHVEEINVRAGDRVQAGQVLMTLGSQEKFEAAVTEARIKLLEAQVELEKRQSGLPLAEARMTLAEAQEAYEKAATQRESKQYARALPDTIELARARYLVAEEAASDAEAFYDMFDDRPESDLDRAEALSQLGKARQERDLALGNLNYLTGMPDEQEIAAADATLDLAKARLEEAQREVDSLIKDGGPELAMAEAKLRNAEAALAETEAILEGLTVKAPFDGVVIDIEVKAGQSVSPGSTLINLSDPTSLIAETTVVEEDYPLVEPGQTAKLFFDAIPEGEVTGKVSQVVPRRVAADRALYKLFIELDQIPEKAAPGMTVDASIVINSKQDVLRLPRSVVRARSDGSANVKVWVIDHIEEREVKVGLRGDSYVEIISGLAEGEKVVSQ